MHRSSLTTVARLIAGVTLITTLTAPTVDAASGSAFDALRAELVSRAGALTGSLDKVEQKQGKTCLKVIATIDKSTTLAGDVKTAGKVIKTLAKAFPGEFAPALLAPAAVTNLSQLVDATVSNLVAEVQTALDDLQTSINGLPPGPSRDSAQASHGAAVDLLTQADSATDYVNLLKLVGSAIKNIAKGVSTVANANGGGGGGGQGLSCQVNGANFNAIGAAGIFVNITGQFTVTGATAQRAVTIIAFGVTGPGTYPAGGGTQVQEVGTGVNYTGNLTGTITITSLNLAQQKATGTFSFTATQTTPVPSTNSVSVTSGTFNISSITQF